MIPRTKVYSLSLTCFSPTANRTAHVRSLNSSMRPDNEARPAPDSNTLLPSDLSVIGRTDFLKQADFSHIVPFDQPPRKCYKTNTLLCGSLYAQRAAKRPAG